MGATVMRVAEIFDRSAKELSSAAQDWGPEEYVDEAKEAIRLVIEAMELPAAIGTHFPIASGINKHLADFLADEGISPSARKPAS
jgi:hypothetical protein